MLFRPWSAGRISPLSPGFATALTLAFVAGCSHRPGTPARPESPPPASPAARPPRPVFECHFTEKPIVIDGKIDDEAWQQAPVIDSFAMPWVKDAPRPRKGTRARVLWDRENLYVAADMDDTDLYADIEEHDGNTWENDVFEVFLKPSADKPAYYEFHVTAANTIFDIFLPRRGHVDRFKRDGEFDIESAVSLRGTLDTWNDKDQGWSAEMRIPWTSLMRTGGRPEPDAEWRFALCRYDFDVEHEQPELSTIAPLSRLSFHLHEDYATLRFVPPPQPIRP